MRRFISTTLLLMVALCARAQDVGVGRRPESVVYATEAGVAVTLDVFEPPEKNGAAIFYLVSSGYFSDRKAIEPDTYRPLLARGYTVFAVVHRSRERASIADIEQDIHRAIRYVRANARHWHVDQNRFGIVGVSSGGQLSLAIATQGGKGDPGAPDLVDRQSSAVQAVACFFPPTDFLNWSKPGEEAVAYGATHGFDPPLGPRGMSRAARRTIEKTVSPIYFVSAKTPPTIIIQGDRDEVVPLFQAESYIEAGRKAGAPVKLLVKPGAGHAYAGWRNDLAICADWFDAILAKP